MKKDEKTEKETTAGSMSEEKNSPEGGKEEKREQSTSPSVNSNSESAPENLSKNSHNFVRISGKKTLLTFCLIVVIVAASFGYVYRDQVKIVLPNELVEFFTGSSQIAEIDIQESKQNEIIDLTMVNIEQAKKNLETAGRVVTGRRKNS